jgi:molybdopterin-guanine dinucleotide biosynthesis protein A
VNATSILFVFFFPHYQHSLSTNYGTRQNMRKGAIILCGGKSSRMGRDKATLRFGRELMLQRVLRLVGEVVDPQHIIVVGAPTQSLPELPAAVNVARDIHEYRGPLQGLATGLREVGDRFDAIYATACDVPLLAPGFVDRMFELLGEYDVAVPFDGQHHHSLAAVYRPRVLPHIQALLDSDRLRPRFLFDLVRTREVPVDDLRDVDPRLATLENFNRYDDYLAALAAAGLATPDETGESSGQTL